MKTTPSLLAGAAFLLAGGLSAVAARTVTGVLEERSVEAVAQRLAGTPWVEVLGDGLQVVLQGEAPSEAARFEAISQASEVVDGARVIDNLRVADGADLAPPDFAVEILRNDAGLSLVGLVPAATDPRAVVAEFAEALPDETVSELLQTADYPVPEGWDAAMDYALDALAELPHARVSVAPGRVSIEAVSASPEDARRLESLLAGRAPTGLRLALAISAPRPVIAPFTVRATLEEGRFAFDACSADTEAARDAILAAAVAAGARGPVDCRLGLGSPTPDWGPAVARGIAALAELGGGTLAVSDADVALVAPAGTDPALFDRVSAELDGALPDPFALEARLPEATAALPDRGPPEFVATLAEDGALRIEGRVEDERMAALARAFALARVGGGTGGAVEVALRPGAEGLPPGWSLRVLAGLEALSRLGEGSVTVTPDSVAVIGRTGERSAGDAIAARALETLGPSAGLEIVVAYDASLDPLAGLPSPEECLARITAVTDAAKITFDPGSATISADGEPVIEAIAEILRSCPDLRLRIAGYTDSQGREESNLELSQARAAAVLAALRAERVPVMGFEAEGFGEASPIASNDTEAGREANRRIEFSLLGPPPDGDGHDHGEVAEGAPGEPAGEAAELPATVTLTVSEPSMPKPDAPPLRPESIEAAGQAFLAARAEETEQAREAGDAPEADEDGALSPEAAIAAIDPESSAEPGTEPGAEPGSALVGGAATAAGQGPEGSDGAAVAAAASPAAEDGPEEPAGEAADEGAAIGPALAVTAPPELPAPEPADAPEEPAGDAPLAAAEAPEPPAEAPADAEPVEAEPADAPDEAADGSADGSADEAAAGSPGGLAPGAGTAEEGAAAGPSQDDPAAY